MTHWINDPDYPLEKRLRATLSLLGDRLLQSEASLLSNASLKSDAAQAPDPAARAHRQKSRLPSKTPSRRKTP